MYFVYSEFLYVIKPNIISLALLLVMFFCYYMLTVQKDLLSLSLTLLQNVLPAVWIKHSKFTSLWHNPKTRCVLWGALTMLSGHDNYSGKVYFYLGVHIFSKCILCSFVYLRTVVSAVLFAWTLWTFSDIKVMCMTLNNSCCWNQLYHWYVSNFMIGHIHMELKPFIW